jgi:hypothetical protein
MTYGSVELAISVRSSTYIFLLQLYIFAIFAVVTNQCTQSSKALGTVAPEGGKMNRILGGYFCVDG